MVSLWGCSGFAVGSLWDAYGIAVALLCCWCIVAGVFLFSFQIGIVIMLIDCSCVIAATLS